jgi:hypothetical protein
VSAVYVSTVAVLDKFSRNGIKVMLLVDILMPYFKSSNIRNKHTTDRQVLSYTGCTCCHFVKLQ